MAIPSYDDLTPPIPDITTQETFARAARLFADPPGGVDRSRAPAAPPVDARGGLFACLHSARLPEAIAAVARDFSPRIERHGTAAVVLDVSGLGCLLGDPQAIGAELARAAAERGRDIRVAVAPTQTAARLLAATCPGLTVVGDAAAALSEIPVAALGAVIGADRQLPGLLDTCRRWGVATLGELAALPAADLSQRLGQAGVALHRLARGIDPAPLVPDPGVPRFTGSMELEWPIDALEPLSFVLARLLEPLAAALERADRGAAALRLDLRLVDRTTHARVLQLPAALRDARVLRTLLRLNLESHPPPAAVDVVSIEVDPAPARIVQYSLLDRALPTAEDTATLMARLRALVGEDRCGSPALVDTHRPDSFAMRAFSPDARRSAALEARAARALALRRFRPPVAVRVTIERQRPVHVAIDRRGMPGGAIGQASGPWRTSGAWWDEAGTAWDRDEWDVAFTDGVVCRIFRDRIGGMWFMEGVVD
jgi:protein ImuB